MASSGTVKIRCATLSGTGLRGAYPACPVSRLAARGRLEWLHVAFDLCGEFVLGDFQLITGL